LRELARRPLTGDDLDGSDNEVSFFHFFITLGMLGRLGSRMRIGLEVQARMEGRGAGSKEGRKERES